MIAFLADIYPKINSKHLSILAFTRTGNPAIEDFISRWYGSCAPITQMRLEPRKESEGLRFLANNNSRKNSKIWNISEMDHLVIQSKRFPNRLWIPWKRRLISRHTSSSWYPAGQTTEYDVFWVGLPDWMPVNLQERSNSFVSKNSSHSPKDWNQKWKVSDFSLVTWSLEFYKCIESCASSIPI